MDRLSWNIDEPMIVSIKHGGTTVMKISVHEIIESCHRSDVLRHVQECDHSPWIKTWHSEKSKPNLRLV